MPVPFVIDNLSHRLADTLNELLAQSAALLGAIKLLAEQFAKDRQTSRPARSLKREDLDLVCYEYLTA
jgi:cobalamin biosynthesis protein CbiD